MVLKLTTPYIHNSHVHSLQTSLLHHGWYSGPIDGQYGPLTAQAVKRAWFYLGAPHPTNVANTLLLALLHGKRPGPVYATLAAQRRMEAKRKAAAVPLGVKALDYLIKHNGMKEHPAGSNICVVSQWYGLTGPWCAMTGIWAYDNVGSRVFTKANGHKYGWAYVPNIVHDARNGNHGLTLTHNPQPGDGVGYDWPGESRGLADHYGTFEKWINRSQGTFFAREGNTGVGNDSNGGELMQRERTLTTVQAFIHIGG